MGYIDITSGIREEDGFPACVKPSDAIKELYEEKIPMDRVTMSSDANGCMSVTLPDGSQKQLAVAPDSFHDEVQAAILLGVPLEIVTRVVSTNPAQANGLYPQKGCLRVDSDEEEGFLALFRSHKALPKNKPLIKFLSEQGIKRSEEHTSELQSR